MITDGVILLAGVLTALVGGTLAENGSIPGSGAVIAVIALASSFGPTAELSALSNNLNHTLASGNRVLDILEEKTACGGSDRKRGRRAVRTYTVPMLKLLMRFYEPDAGGDRLRRHKDRGDQYGSASESREPFCTMRMFCFWMNRPAILTA